MSGYEIKSVLEENDSQRWAGILLGSIYNALKKLEKENYIEVARLENSGYRQKAIYQITEKGKLYQNELILNCLSNSKMYYPTELFSGISLADNVKKEEAIEQLEKNKKELKNELIIINSGKELKVQVLGEDIPELTLLIFKHMKVMINNQLELVDSAINILRKEQS